MPLWASISLISWRLSGSSSTSSTRQLCISAMTIPPVAMPVAALKSAHEPGQAVQQVVEPERLGDVAVKPGIDHALGILGHRQGGQRDDRDVVQMGPLAEQALQVPAID